MLNIPHNPRVRTRIPISMWVVAGVVTLFSIVTSLMDTSFDRHRLLVAEASKRTLLADSTTFRTASAYMSKLF
jgi:hypothetical protein